MVDRILRLPSVVDRLGKSRSSIYDDITKSMFPRPISLGGRSVGWREAEVDAIVKARIAGKSETEIRQLVQTLEQQRRVA
jgi:prophage regulatory protein